MRKIIIALSIILSFGKLFAQWETVYFLPPNPNLPSLNATRFFNGTTGLACGYKDNPIEGVIIRTTDSGTTWDTVLVDNTTIMEKIAILNNSTAIVVGRPNNPNTSKVYKTVDSGQTWNSTSFPNTSFSSVHFANQSTGFVTDKLGTIFRSQNSGNSWQNIAVISDTLKEVFALSPTNVFIISNGYLYSSIDGGLSWGNLYFNGEYLLDLTFYNNVGYILACVPYDVPADLLIYKTTDGGVTWNKVATIFSQLPHMSIYFSSANIGYIVGQFSVYNTTDGGFTWNSQTSGPPSWGNFMDWLTDVYFVNVDTGYITGISGDFYRLPYQTNSISKINTTDFQLFPNPANDILNVVVETNSTKEISISVYNLEGQLAIEETYNNKNEVIQINVSTLPMGMYLVKIRTDNIVVNKKIVINK